MEEIKQVKGEANALYFKVQSFAGSHTELTADECKDVLWKCDVLRNHIRAIQSDIVIHFLWSEAKLFGLWLEAKSLKKNDKALKCILSTIANAEEILLTTMKVRGLT